MKYLLENKAVRIICIALAVTACLALPAYLIYESAKGMIIEELNKNAINIAATTAGFIEQDISDYIGLPSNGNESPDNGDIGYYEELMRRFEIIEKETGAANVFTEKRIRDQDKAIIFDGSLSNFQEPLQKKPPMGMSKEMSAEELQAFNEGIKTNSGLVWDQAKGEFITGYAPIFDTEIGVPVGIIGVEFALDYTENILHGIRVIIFFSFAVIMLLTTFVVNSLMSSRWKYYKEDYMTGLVNKRYFEEYLKTTVKRVTKTGKKLSLIMIDVDYFKTINDTLGHVMGDMVIISVAKSIQAHIRNDDLCCRCGGDEFAVSLVDTDSAQAFEIAERIRLEIENIKPTGRQNEPVCITLSIGIAEYRGGQSATKLYDCADKAMYVSKNTGKNKTVVYDEAQVF
jgi:diguanylate cyclase (GGDEF)-like protein